MKAEYTAEDFARAKPNPYYHRLNKEVTVALNNADYEYFEQLAALNGEPLEEQLRRSLHYSAERFREDDEINAGRLPMRESKIVTYRG